MKEGRRKRRKEERKVKKIHVAVSTWRLCLFVCLLLFCLLSLVFMQCEEAEKWEGGGGEWRRWEGAAGRWKGEKGRRRVFVRLFLLVPQAKSTEITKKKGKVIRRGVRQAKHRKE